MQRATSVRTESLAKSGFVHRAPASREVLDGANVISGQQYKVRNWQHIVAQKKGDRLILVLDGQISAELSDPAPLPADIQIRIGQLYPTKKYRAFVGQIDEVAIYDRSLSLKELQKHIRAAGRSVAPEKSGSSVRGCDFL